MPAYEFTEIERQLGEILTELKQARDTNCIRTLLTDMRVLLIEAGHLLLETSEPQSV